MEIDRVPTYVIYYKDKQWMLEFMHKRLGKYSEDILSHDFDEDENYIYEFKNFRVYFLQIDEITDKNYFGKMPVFGVLIQDGIKIEDAVIDNYIVPNMENPFIGGIHTIR